MKIQSVKESNISFSIIVLIGKYLWAIKELNNIINKHIYYILTFFE